MEKKNLEQELSEQLAELKAHTSKGYDIYVALITAWTKYQNENNS